MADLDWKARQGNWDSDNLGKLRQHWGQLAGFGLGTYNCTQVMIGQSVRWCKFSGWRLPALVNQLLCDGICHGIGQQRRVSCFFGSGKFSFVINIDSNTPRFVLMSFADTWARFANASQGAGVMCKDCPFRSVRPIGTRLMGGELQQPPER